MRLTIGSSGDGSPVLVHAAAASSNRLLTGVLVGVAAAALLVRCVAIAEPLGIDQSLWASAVRGLARGQLLYQDVWEQRPPGIYWTYLAAFRIFGWTPAAVAWLDILASAATTLLLFHIGRALGGTVAGGWSAALYAVLTMPAWLYRYGGFLERAVCETFIVACIGGSFLCAVKFRERGSAATLAAAGLLAGAAVVYKPNAGLYFLAVLGWVVFYARSTVPRRALMRALAFAAGASAVMPLVAIAWLWWHGLIQEAWVAVVQFNRYYVGEGFTIGGYALDFSRAVWLRMKTDPLWLAGGAGALVVLWDLSRTRRLPPLAGLAVAWGGAAALVIVVNGARLFNSYFIQAFAPLTLLAVWLLLQVRSGAPARRAVAAAAAALMIMLAVQRNYAPKVIGSTAADLAMLRGRMDRAAYLDQYGGYATNRGYSARANEELAAYVRERTGPDDRIYLFGINGAGVYFAADRLTAHRFLRVNFFVETDFPDPRFRLDAVVAELRAARPRYLIFEQLHSTSAMARAADALPDSPAVRDLLDDYELENRIEDFTVYRLIE